MLSSRYLIAALRESRAESFDSPTRMWAFFCCPFLNFQEIVQIVNHGRGFSLEVGLLAHGHQNVVPGEDLVNVEVLEEEKN